MLESSAIVHDASPVFSQIFFILCNVILVASPIFGDVRMSPVAPAHANCAEIINSIFRDRPNLVMLKVIPVAPRNVLDVSGATTTNQERFLAAGAIFCKFAG